MLAARFAGTPRARWWSSSSPPLTCSSRPSSRRSPSVDRCRKSRRIPWPSCPPALLFGLFLACGGCRCGASSPRADRTACCPVPARRLEVGPTILFDFRTRAPPPGIEDGVAGASTRCSASSRRHGLSPRVGGAARRVLHRCLPRQVIRRRRSVADRALAERRLGGELWRPRRRDLGSDWLSAACDQRENAKRACVYVRACRRCPVIKYASL